MDIRYRCRMKIEQASPMEQAAFYQCRYKGDRSGQMAQLLRILMKPRKTSAGGRDLFADYKGQKIFSRSSVVEELEPYDVISFDVFDTLLMRTVSRPEDVFSKMEKKYDAPGFRKHRIKAERAARQYQYEQCRSTEIAAEDIYRVLNRQRKYQDRSIFRAGSLSISIEQEVAVELQCCKPNPVVRQLAEQLLMEGKKVIAVSDMYLHQEQILQILHKCGYMGISKIYVSCDYKAGKSDGKLFPIVLSEIGNGKRMAHIGDNFYADVCRPEGLGIRTIHYIRCR